MATKQQPINVMDVSVGDFYAGLDDYLRGIRGMNLARWKLLQNTAISGLVAWLALGAGADPTIAVIIIAVINGISIADLATIWGISVELRGEGPPVELGREQKNEDDEQREKEIERR